MEENEEATNPFANVPDFLLEGVPALLNVGAPWIADPTPFAVELRSLLRSLVKAMKKIPGARKIGRKRWTTQQCTPLNKKRFFVAMGTADAMNRALILFRRGDLNQAMRAAFHAGLGFQMLMDSAYDESVLIGKKVSKGGQTGATKAHGDTAEKYRKMQAALDEYRASHLGAKVKASQRIVAMQHAAEGWTESTVRRADEARK